MLENLLEKIVMTSFQFFYFDQYLINDFFVFFLGFLILTTP